MLRTVKSCFNCCMITQSIVFFSVLATIQHLGAGATGGRTSLSQSLSKKSFSKESGYTYDSAATLPQYSAGAPSRYQQEEPPNVNIEDDTIYPNPESPGAIDESNLSAIEIVQESDTAWKTLLNQKIFLESIETSFTEEQKTKLSHTISEGLATVSNISDLIGQKLGIPDKPYIDEEHQDELRADYTEIKNWAEVSNNIEYILSNPTAFDESLLKPGSRLPSNSWKPPNEITVLSPIVTQYEEEKEDKIKNLDEGINGGINEDEKNDNQDKEEEDDEEKSIALPPIVPGSGMLSSSNLNESDPVEGNLIQMEQQGLELQRIPEDEFDLEQNNAASPEPSLVAFEEVLTTELPQEITPESPPPEQSLNFEDEIDDETSFIIKSIDETSEFLNNNDYPDYITTNAPTRVNQDAGDDDSYVIDPTITPTFVDDINEGLASLEDSFLNDKPENTLLEKPENISHPITNNEDLTLLEELENSFKTDFDTENNSSVDEKEAFLSPGLDEISTSTESPRDFVEHATTSQAEKATGSTSSGVNFDYSFYTAASLLGLLTLTHSLI